MDPDKIIVGIEDLPKVIETCGDAQYVLSLLPDKFCPLDEVKEVAKFCGRKSKHKKLQKISKSICATAVQYFSLMVLNLKSADKSAIIFLNVPSSMLGK